MTVQLCVVNLKFVLILEPIPTEVTLLFNNAIVVGIAHITTQLIASLQFEFQLHLYGCIDT